MIIPNINGKSKNINISKYLIDWNKASASIAQTNAKKFLQKYWSADRVCEEFRVPGSRLRIDFINFSKKIVLEVSGQQHEKFVEFYHKNRLNFLKSIKRDVKKLDWVENIICFKFLEITDKEASTLTEEFFLTTLGVKL